MENVRVKWDVNETRGVESITLEELDVSSLDEWNELSSNEQRDLLQAAIESLPERVFIIVDDWEITE